MDFDCLNDGLMVVSVGNNVDYKHKWKNEFWVNVVSSLIISGDTVAVLVSDFLFSIGFFDWVENLPDIIRHIDEYEWIFVDFSEYSISGYKIMKMKLELMVQKCWWSYCLWF